jgi:NADPH:quinone reductase-like Zn-dependent oxidoreductase
VLRIAEVPTPEPGDQDLVVRVHATTVNRTDCGALAGAPYVFRFFVGWPSPRHVTTGTDFAGEVTAVGRGVSRFKVGDRVMGFDDNNLGSHAEYVRVPKGRAVVKIPEGVSYEEAAASMEGAHYARNFLRVVPLQAGDPVLVYGATGAIGSAALALLKAADAQITAVCASPHLDMIQRLGAHRVIDYTTRPFVEQLRGERFAFVFDAVGKSTFGVCRALLRDDGAYVSSELGPWGQNLFYALLAPLMRGPKVRFPLPIDIPRSLELVTSLLASGNYRPLIDPNRYTLEGIRDAFAYVASGQKLGNVLLLPNG